MKAKQLSGESVLQAGAESSIEKSDWYTTGTSKIAGWERRGAGVEKISKQWGNHRMVAELI